MHGGRYEPPSPQAAQEMLRKLPMRFEANEGQLHPQVKYYSRSSEQLVLFTENEAILQLSDRVLSIRPQGGNPAPRLTGTDLLPARSSYYLGPRPAAWRTGVRQYGAVSYREVYPGIDLIYRGRGRRLEYDFVVAPGAEPSRVRLRFDGADKMWIDRDGTLVMKIGRALLHQPKPFIYQGTPRSPEPVEGGYRLVGKKEIVFEVGRYDPTRTLVIDPVLTYFGTSGKDDAVGVAVDPEGFLWVVGKTNSAELPLTGEPVADALKGKTDIFVARLNPSLQGADALVYSTYLGGSDDDEPTSVFMRGSNLYIAGSTASTDFPIANGYQSSNGGDRDAFVIWLNVAETGSSILWYSSYFGGADREVANAVSADAAGKIYAAGYTTSTEKLPLLGGSLQPANRGGWEAFLFVADPSLSESATGVYSTYLGGVSTDVATAIAVDQAGRVILAGYTMSGDFPVAGDSYQLGYRGGGDAFVTVVDLSKPGLEALVYATYLGGSDYEAPKSLTAAAGQEIYIAGYTLSSDFPTSLNAYRMVSAGAADAFVARLDWSKPAFESLTYSTYVGGSRSDLASSMALDANGQVLLTGYTYSDDFPLMNAGPARTYLGAADGFFVRLDPSKPAAEGLTCSMYIASPGIEAGNWVAADAAGNAFVAGSTTSGSLEADPGAYRPATAGYAELFVTRISATECAPPQSQ